MLVISAKRHLVLVFECLLRKLVEHHRFTWQKLLLLHFGGSVFKFVSRLIDAVVSYGLEQSFVVALTSNTSQESFARNLGQILRILHVAGERRNMTLRHTESLSWTHRLLRIFLMEALLRKVIHHLFGCLCRLVRYTDIRQHLGGLMREDVIVVFSRHKDRKGAGRDTFDIWQAWLSVKNLVVDLDLKFLYRLRYSISQTYLDGWLDSRLL